MTKIRTCNDSLESNCFTNLKYLIGYYHKATVVYYCCNDYEMLKIDNAAFFCLVCSYTTYLLTELAHGSAPNSFNKWASSLEDEYILRVLYKHTG